ncbi:NUDIX hydrolase [Nocardia sp. 2]|uniref:NUDIX hydrolase n=1 Tax=Nocardia acididurans TaxID=2802282 RepID=A0ABS1M8Y1_9NOCA|nr:NUDIX hydrolase [Nocardia acididurans]MBL1077105.1 NUDIX hydrolase [Nocardia acididurans]
MNSDTDRFVAHAWVSRGDKVLLLRRRAGRYLGSQWDVPGGTVEDGESCDEAAIRETWEEAGLRVSVAEELAHYTNADTHGRPLTFHTVTYRAIEIASGPVTLAPAEHDDHRWATLQEALRLDLVWHVRSTVRSLLDPETAG